MAGTQISLPFSGQLLRTLRERRGMNQQKLALRCGEVGLEISRGQISKLELEVHKPSPETLDGLCRALGVEVDALLKEPVAS